MGGRISLLKMLGDNKDSVPAKKLGLYLSIMCKKLGFLAIMLWQLTMINLKG